MQTQEQPPARIRVLNEEAELLRLIRQGELMNWICNRADNPVSAEAFLNHICRLLSGMQRKGLVTGFLATKAGGRMLPIVSSVSLTSLAVSQTISA
jgi:hypothetical protein